MYLHLTASDYPSLLIKTCELRQYRGIRTVCTYVNNKLINCILKPQWEGTIS
ncbi:unnamed protein product, partial [Schistosoma haematobium]